MSQVVPLALPPVPQVPLWLYGNQLKARWTYSFSNFLNESRNEELGEKGNAQFALNTI